MSKKILLVDDSPTSRLTSRMILGKRNNYELVSASDGQECVEMALTEKPDLILMDVTMPRMSGLEACRTLKDQPATRQIPVILVTTRSEKSVVEQAHVSGCNDFMTKPVDEQKLMALLKTYLGE
ncbi:MAG: response regulator [Acidobacteriia bacterium]|nr:response regulator [Terriglobia bacterium]